MEIVLLIWTKAQKGVSYYYAVKAYVKEPYGNTYSKYKSSSAVKENRK